MSQIAIQSVGKTFHTASRAVPVLDDVSFSVEEGEFVTVIGPSGSGKSTLFNILAGLLAPDSGSVTYANGETATEHVGYMPQRDLLLPWLRVQDNAGLPLELAGADRETARRTVAGHLEDFGLSGFERAYPAELSGGMRQRAALLRTVLTGREILLLDEPFGALDALTRKQMQDWLLERHGRLNRTVLFITHDVDEAVYLADRVVVLSPRPGRVVREIPVPLPRPRRQTMVEMPEFGHTAGALLRDLGL